MRGSAVGRSVTMGLEPVSFRPASQKGGDVFLRMRVAKSRRLRRHRGRREAGAVLVEAALILPLVVLLFMGIIDFGTAIADTNSLRQGGRDGVRRAVVADVGDDTGCTIGGFSGSDDLARLICQTKKRTGLDAADTRVAVKFDPSYAEGDELILCTQYPLRSITGFFGFLLDDKIATARVDMRIEKASLDIEEFEETGGGSWDWCG